MLCHQFKMQHQTESVDKFHSEFSQYPAIATWVKELRIATSSGSIADWSMLGRGVILTHFDLEDGLELIRSVARHAEMNFVELDADALMQAVINDQPLTQELPALVYVPLGAWSNKIENNDHTSSIAAFQRKLPHYLCNLDPSHAVILVCVRAAIGNVSPDIRRHGAFDRFFLVNEPTRVELGQSFLEMVGRIHCDASLTDSVGKVGTLLDTEIGGNRRFGLIVLAMKRLAKRENRQVSFSDLINFVFDGVQETHHKTQRSESFRYQLAVHEAGHALIAMIDSSGANIPDYASIIYNGQFEGMLVVSSEYRFSRDKSYSYRDARHDIRVDLAGRAAEELLFGAENVDVYGAGTDLENATRLAKRLMSECGVSQNMEVPGTSRHNLAVILSEPTASESAYFEEKVRQFLASQYAEVILMLKSNRVMLLSITDLLLKKKILDQSDMRLIWNEQVGLEQQLVL